jgi:hypothetical protein
MAPYILDLGTGWELSGKRHAAAALLPGNRDINTHWI